VTPGRVTPPMMRDPSPEPPLPPSPPIHGKLNAFIEDT
jgi:hypothetical protein